MGESTGVGGRVATGRLTDRAVRTAMWRLLPFLGLCYLLNYVDRVNVGFAALTMNPDLGLSAAAYGLGAGLFFIGIALINSFGNLSGFVGPYLTGWLSDLTGSFRAGMSMVAGFMTLAAVTVVVLGRWAAPASPADSHPPERRR